MKLNTPRLLASLIFLGLLCACTTTSTVIPMTEGTYLVSKTGGSFAASLASLKKQAFDEASAFASQRGAKVEVIYIHDSPSAWGKFPQVDLKFRLVEADKK